MLRNPRVDQPALIVDGVHGDIVPVEHSLRFAAENSRFQLREVDDTHELWNSMPGIRELTRGFLAGGENVRGVHKPSDGAGERRIDRRFAEETH